MRARVSTSMIDRRRRGVTLVEMMVAITITLIMIGALTEAFTWISESVSDSRAMIGITEATRKTTLMLQRDLDGLTVPARPWPESASGLGYLEIVEGVGSDLNPQPTLPTAPTTVEQQSLLHLLGDFDDSIQFTSVSRGEPFMGRIQAKYLIGDPFSTAANMQEHQAIDSSLAEIIWWTNFDSFVDADGDGFQDNDPSEIETDNVRRNALELEANESVVLRRRALLIRPDLNNASGHLGILVHPRSGATSRQVVSDFLANNDISVRIEPVANAAGTAWEYYYLAANTLADLTRRENRAAHMLFHSDGHYLPVVGGTPSAPEFDVNRYRLNRDAPPILYKARYEATAIGSAMTEGKQSTSQYTTYPDGSGFSDVITGDATMLGNVLAFDVKVFDPQAPILDLGDGVAMAPVRKSSGMYPAHSGGNWTVVDSNGSQRPVNLIGSGEFVDLNYSGGTYSGSLFSAAHADNAILAENVYWTRSEPTQVVFPHEAFTYDTWSWDYERDGFDQDGDMLFDEGTNGLDDTPFTNGVDDVGERETTPPYPHPLRGVQITIRVHDVSTRQVRQVSVVSDFTPE